MNLLLLHTCTGVLRDKLYGVRVRGTDARLLGRGRFSKSPARPVWQVGCVRELQRQSANRNPPPPRRQFRLRQWKSVVVDPG